MECVHVRTAVEEQPHESDVVVSLFRCYVQRAPRPLVPAIHVRTLLEQYFRNIVVPFDRRHVKWCRLVPVPGIDRSAAVEQQFHKGQTGRFAMQSAAESSPACPGHSRSCHGVLECARHRASDILGSALRYLRRGRATTTLRFPRREALCNGVASLSFFRFTLAPALTDASQDWDFRRRLKQPGFAVPGSTLEKQI